MRNMHASTRKEILVVFLFLGILTVGMAPLFWGGKIFSDSDTLSLFYPFFTFYRDALLQKESFLWNPSIFSGFPTYLSQAGGFFDPVNYALFSLWSAATGYHIRLFIDFFLVLFFSYLAGRAYGLSRSAAVLIGMGYLLAPHVGFLVNSTVANVLFLVPFLLYVFSKLIDPNARWWIWSVLGGIGLGWTLLSGLTQLVVYTVTLVSLFVLFYLFFLRRDIRVPSYRALLFHWGLVLAVGILVGLPQILPALQFTPLTLRAEGVSYAIAAGRSVDPGDVMLFFFPNYLYFPHFSVGRKALYIGAFLFFMAVLASAALFHNRSRILKSDPTDRAIRTKTLAAFFCTALFAFLLSFDHSPLFYIVQHVPVFSWFRYADRWMFIGAFFFAFLGAFGFDAAKEYAGNRKMKILFSLLGIGVGALAAVVLMLNTLGKSFWSTVAVWVDKALSLFLYGNFGYIKDPAHYREVVLRGILAWRDFLSLGDITFLLPFLFLVLAFLLAVLFLWQVISWKRFREMGIALSVATFLGVFLAYAMIQMIPFKALVSYDDAFGRLIPADDRALYRVYPFSLDSGLVAYMKPIYHYTREQAAASTELKYSTGWPNINMFSARPAVLSADGYDPLILTSYFDALVAIGSTFGGQYETGTLPIEEKSARLLAHLDVVGMLGGKYIISGEQLASVHLRPLGEVPVSRYQIPVFLYENDYALPRIYFAPETESRKGASLAAFVRDPAVDFQKKTYLDCDSCAAPGRVFGARITALSMKNGWFDISTGTEKPQWLVVSETMIPGWRAEIDGNEAPLVRANGISMALLIPPGAHRVTLSYEGINGEARILRALGVMR